MNDTILVHHGVGGQKWGNRKYQYEDGSLTPLGRIHYGVGEARDRAKIEIKKQKAFAKSEASVIKAKAKAEIAKTRAAAKAQAKAEKDRLKAEAKAYKDKRKNDDDVEREKIKTEKELELAAMREQSKDAKENRKFERELMNQGKKTEANRVKTENETARKALKVIAAVGIGYLLYRGLTSDSGSGGGSGVSGITASTANAGQAIVNKNKSSLLSSFFNKGSEKVNRTSFYNDVLAKGVDKDHAAYYTHQMFSNGVKKIPRETYNKFFEVLGNQLGHSEEYNMKDQIICHHGVKGQKWGVIREKDDYDTHGRTKNVTGEVEGVEKRKKDATSQYLKSQPQQNYYSTGHPIAKPNYKIEWAGYSRDEDPAYAKYGISYGLNGKEGPKTKKEYIKFMENEVNELVRQADKVGYYQTAYTLSKYIERYAAKKAIKLSSGENVTYQDIQEVYTKAYDSILKKYQEEQRYLRDERKRKEKLKETLKKKQEIAKQYKKVNNKPKTNTKDPKIIHKVKHSSSDGMILIHSEDICHHGIKGQKWGVRRWQYEDGTLTPEGKIHYSKSANKRAEKAEGWRNVQTTTKALRPLSTAVSAAEYTALGAMMGGGAGALIGGPVGALATYGAMSAVSFIAKKFSQRNQKKVDEINDIMEKYGGQSLSDFKEQQKAIERAKERYKDEPDVKETNSKNDNKYDLDFQEWTQNDERNEDSKWMQKEYDKYKKDPQKWLTDYRNKEDAKTVAQLPKFFEMNKNEATREKILASHEDKLKSGDPKVEKAFNQIFQIKGKEFKTEKPKQYAEELAEWKQNYTTADIKRMGFNSYEEALNDEIGRRSYNY